MKIKSENLEIFVILLKSQIQVELILSDKKICKKKSIPPLTMSFYAGNFPGYPLNVMGRE